MQVTSQTCYRWVLLCLKVTCNNFLEKVNIFVVLKGHFQAKEGYMWGKGEEKAQISENSIWQRVNFTLSSTLTMVITSARDRSCALQGHSVQPRTWWRPPLRAHGQHLTWLRRSRSASSQIKAGEKMFFPCDWDGINTHVLGRWVVLFFAQC